MKVAKRILAIIFVITILVTIATASIVSSSAQGSGTGLAAWALNAYYSGWSYVYGGCTPGAVDCSGLIYSYTYNERCGDDQLYASSCTGSVSSGIPNIHGLGLWQPGHVGVYVGNSMAVDARGDQYGVVYESAYAHNWYTWFKVNGVSYPYEGWEEFQGDYYYYEDGEYLTNTSRTFNGETYYFSSSGASSSSPSDNESYSDNSSSESSSSSSLKLGSNGSKVKELQERLAELGYYDGSIDGDFGTGTEKAFMLFQEACGLEVDGIAGSDAEYLFSVSAPAYNDVLLTGASNDEEEVEEIEEEKVSPTYKKGDFDEEIIKIQEQLTKLGYFTGDADGSFGTTTENAILAFQKANGLEETGIADEKTIELLFSEDAKTKETEKVEETKAAETIVKPVVPAKQEVATEVELETNKLSAKALANIADKIQFTPDKNGNNFEFLYWLILMIGILIIAFITLYIIERRKMSVKRKESIKNFK